MDAQFLNATGSGWTNTARHLSERSTTRTEHSSRSSRLLTGKSSALCKVA